MGTISRRSFLKQSSAVGLAAVAVPGASALAQTSATTKSRVVMVTDDACYDAGTVNNENIEKMVVEAVKALTGETDIGKAFEALFPAAVTNSTKIILKRNDLSGNQRDFAAVDTVITAAFKDGLTKMLGGTFPAANVDIHCNGGSMLTKITNANYIINCPVLSCHGTDYGVTLSCKNTMIYLNNASTYHSADKKWLYEVSLDTRIKTKQVMSMMNAVVGNHQSGPTQAPNIMPKTIIMSKDIIAVDYNGLRLMEKQTSPKPSASRIATGDAQLKKAEEKGLGTCTPENMEVILLKPPYTTGIIQEHNHLVKQLSVSVVDHSTSFEFSFPGKGAHAAEIALYDMKGTLIWRSAEATGGSIFWKKESASGARVPAGSYLYRIRQGSGRLNGIVMIAR